MSARTTIGQSVFATLQLVLITACCFGQQPAPIDWSKLGTIKVKASVTVETPLGTKVDGAAIIRFAGHHAFVTPDGAKPARYSNIPPFTAFDLANMSWEDSESRVLVDLKSCQAWEKTSIERTKASMTKETDPAIRAFLESLIDPKFQVAPGEGGATVISNSHLRYAATPYGNVPPEQCQRFYRYDRLNAYHKAMIDRKVPPTAQLAVDDILLQKNILPKQLSNSIKTATGTVKTESTFRFESFTLEDDEFVKSALAKLGPTARTAAR